MPKAIVDVRQRAIALRRFASQQRRLASKCDAMNYLPEAEAARNAAQKIECVLRMMKAPASRRR